MGTGGDPAIVEQNPRCEVTHLYTVRHTFSTGIRVGRVRATSEAKGGPWNYLFAQIRLVRSVGAAAVTEPVQVEVGVD